MHLTILIGETGAGKSSFIVAAQGKNAVHSPLVHDGLGSCEQQADTYSATDPKDGKECLLVDTPGFNDTYSTEDRNNLENLIKWLNERPMNEVIRVLFLVEITRARATMPGGKVVTPMNFPSPPGVLVVTAHWSKVKKGEDDLENRWATHLGISAESMMRFDGTCESAWKIIRASNQRAASTSYTVERLVLQLSQISGAVKREKGSVLKRLKVKLLFWR